MQKRSAMNAKLNSIDIAAGIDKKNMATDTTERLHFDLDRTDAEIRIGLEQEPRVQVCEILQRLLADEIALYTKTRNYHWNVMGPRFHTLRSTPINSVGSGRANPGNLLRFCVSAAL
jgi:hypothetical protein